MHYFSEIFYPSMSQHCECYWWVFYPAVFQISMIQITSRLDRILIWLSLVEPPTVAQPLMGPAVAKIKIENHLECKEVIDYDYSDHLWIDFRLTIVRWDDYSFIGPASAFVYFSRVLVRASSLLVRVWNLRFGCFIWVVEKSLQFESQIPPPNGM